MDSISVKYMKEALARDMIVFMCENYRMSLPDAMNTVYTSETFRLLQDDDQFMFTQSPTYLIDCLEKEIKFGKIYG